MLIFPKNIFIRFDGKTFSKMNDSVNFLNLDNPCALEIPRIRQFLCVSFLTLGLSTFKKFSDSSIFEEVFPSKRTKMFFGKISTYTCIQALKCRMQALSLVQIQNLESDFRGFDFLLFLGINSETNKYSSDQDAGYKLLPRYYTKNLDIIIHNRK